MGGACQADESCVTGVCIPEASAAWSGGYCSGDCASTACPQGLCLVLADGLSYCVAECASDGDCRQDYICSAGVGACLPDCRLGWSCGSSLVCDMATVG